MWKRIQRNYRRLVASLLTLVMVATNVGGNLGTVFASGETENALFLVDGEELRDAIREAEEQGEVFDFSALHMAAKRKSIKTRYEKLLGKKEGAVYALNLEIDDSYAPEGTELQVFYHAETEDVIFLFLNGSDLVVDYRVNIDGYETEPVRVNPNTVNIEADGEDAPSYAENYEAADMIDDEGKNLGAEVLNPTETSGEEESKSDASKEEIGDEVTETEDQTGDDSQKETDGSDVSEGTEGTDAADEENEKGTDAAENETLDKKEEGGDESEAETEAEDIEETETEAEEETEEDAAEIEKAAEASSDEEDHAEDGELLSISRHEAAIVTISVDELEDGDAEIIEEKTEAPETEEETEAEKETETSEAEEETETSETKTETEASEEEKETEVSETETEKETEKETETETEGEKETGSEAETETNADDESESKAEETETETDAVEKGEDNENGEDIKIEETDKSGSIDESDGKDSSAVTDPDSDAGIKDDQPDMEGQLLEDDDIEILGELKGKEYDTVTILDHINAKALKIAWEDIEAIIISDAADVEYAVNYEVNLPEGASVKGVDAVADGGDLYFAVEVEVGYEILNVFANGVEAEEIDRESDLASASDWKGYSHAYVVRTVSEDLDIEIEVEEVYSVIPAVTYEVETEDAVITVDVPEGAFEEEVEFRAEKIQEESLLQELTSQAEEAIEEGRTVEGILAYDLTFVTKSEEEVEPGKPVDVKISFKENAIPEEIAENATAVSVVHLPEGEAAEVEATIESTDVEELNFQAESFSVRMAVFTREAEISRDGWEKIESLEDLHKQLYKKLVVEGEKEKKLYLEKNIVTNDDKSGNTDFGWAIPKGKKVTLDLNGHTLTYGAGGPGKERRRLFYVRGNFTIMDSSKGNGIINSAESIDGTICVAGGTLNFEGGTIKPGEGCTNEHGVVVGADDKDGNDPSGYGIFNMKGGSIENNGAATTNGGGIYLEKGTVNINGGSVKGNTAKNGGGIYVVKGNINVRNGSIEENTATDGGGIYVNSGWHEISGGEIKKNTAKNNGGGIYDANAASLKFNNGTLDSNKAAVNGGGLYIDKGKLAISGGEIKENRVGNNGGGIYICPDASVEVTGNTKIISNHSDKVEPPVSDTVGYYAGSGGGGIFSNGKLKITGGEISNNEAVADGGGIYVDFIDGEQGKSSFLMTDGVVDHNKAKNGEGGGIYFGWNGTIEGGSITNNETHTLFDWGGGGIFIQTGVTVKMTNALITDNTAEGFGGGVAGCPSGDVKIFTINGVAIYDNHATGEGMTHRTEADKKTQDKEAHGDPLFMKGGLYQDYYCQNKSIVYGKMLGGGSANWKGSSKQSKGGITEEITIDRYEHKSASYRMGLSADPDESGKTNAESRARVRITGNTSTTHGAGIMCNGLLELGEKGPGYFEVSKTVLGSEEEQKKDWVFTLSLFDSEGNPLEVESGVSDRIDSGMEQDRIAFALKNKQNGDEEAGIEYGTLALERGTTKFTLKHGQTIIFDDLPEGTIYHVIEDEANKDGYITSVKGSEDTIAVEDEEDATKVVGAEGVIRISQSESQNQGRSWVDFVNMQLSDLSVSKKVVGKTNEESWTFVLTLLDEDGKPLKGLPNPLASAELLDTVAFERFVNGEKLDEGRLPIDEKSGQVTFVLGNNQTITFKDIPAGTLYQIVEDGAEENGFEIKVSGTAGSTELKDKEDSTRVIGIEGTVVPDRDTGSTAAVKFINARLSSLAVSKSVIGDENAKSEDWEFELKLHRGPDTPSFAELQEEWELDSGMQQLVLPYEISAGGTVVDTGSLAWNDQEDTWNEENDEGKIRFTLKHGQTITIKDIPVGSTYEISEVKANENGFVTSVAGSVDYMIDHNEKIKGIKGVIADGQTAKASFINTKTNILTVSKAVKGNDEFNDYEWSFTLNLSDEKGNAFGISENTSQDVDAGMQVPVVAYKGGSMLAGVEALPDGSVSLENGITHFRLKHGQFITFVDLPVGTTYTVTEDEANTKGLFVEVKGSEGSTITEHADGVTGTIADGKPAIVDFVNQSGKLIVKKIVRGNKADPEKEFPFTVTLDDKSINGQFGEMNFTNGVAEIKLKDGESVKADGLPVHVSYVVEEHDNADYVVESSNASGEITTDGILVTFINTKNENPPGRPDRPSGGGGGGNPPSGGNNPGGPGTTTIDEPGVPLANLPTETVTELIEDSDVPLAALPKTGDSRHTKALMMMFGIAGLGMLLAAAGLRRRKDESDG